MSLDFTAIDFETANRQRGSVCAVGMTKVRDGAVVESVSWLIMPPTGKNSFDPWNIRVHGITPADVADAVDWASSLVRIVEFIGEDPIVAHYAQFDKSVFHRSAEAIGAEATGDEWNCSWRLAKHHLDLVDYKLPTVAAELGIEGLNHHDAGSDALVCAQLVLAIAERVGTRTLQDLWPAIDTRSAGGTGHQKFYSRGYSVKKEDLPAPNPDANPYHPLFGQTITVTGDFEMFSRMEAFELAAGFGASIELNTTLKTSILIVCLEDPHSPDFDLSAGSGKQAKAHKYITEKGRNIQVLSQRDFYILTGIIEGEVGS
jgi:DNA polymerase-3 subunit epsilon